MKDLMIDLETMGNGHNAPIIAIGACYFNPETGEIGDEFYTEVNLQSSVECGAEMDASTVLWWMEQSDDARGKFAKNAQAQNMVDALHDLASFCVDGCKPWGNGSTFDITILESAYKSIFESAPWAFWNVRDVRTVVDVCNMKGIDCRGAIEFTGTPHYALDDAIHQAKYVSFGIQSL